MPELKRHHTNRVVGGAFTARSRQSGRGGAMYPRRRAPCRGAEDHKLAAEAAPTGNELALVGAASAASASRRSCFHEDAAALRGRPWPGALGATAPHARLSRLSAPVRPPPFAAPASRRPVLRSAA